VITAIVSAIIV